MWKILLWLLGSCRARITEETQRAVAALAPFGQAEFLTELAQRLTSRDH